MSTEAATHSDLTPHAVQARQALVTLDASVTAVALGRRVTLYPYMLHSLEGRRERAKYKVAVSILTSNSVKTQT